MAYVSDYYQSENRALLIIEYGCDWWPQINSFRVATLYIYIYHPYPYADSGWFIYLSIVYSYGCYVWKQGNEKHLEFYIITIEHKLMISHLCKLALVKIRFGTDMHWGIIKSSGNQFLDAYLRFCAKTKSADSHYSDIIMSDMASKITGIPFTQPFVQAQIKENIKALCHWPLWGEVTGDQWGQ